MVLRHPTSVEQRPLTVEEVRDPVPATGEVRVHVSVCGVCHTDLHTVEGELPLPKVPIIPGHQVVGHIDALGVGVHSLREGDRVGIPWLYWADGSCQYCKRGDENLCEQGRFTGLHADGGYAERIVADEGFAHPLPESFSDLHAAPLLCAGVIGYRSYRLSGARAGDRIGLYGFGASAHIVLQFARHLGCEVYVFTRSEQHRELAHSLGAVWTGTAQDKPPGMLDCAIVFAPAGSLVLEALRVLRKGGVVALAGITMSSIPEMDYDLIYQERVVRSVANSTRQDVREFLELAAEVPVRSEVQEYDLEQANEALLDLKHSRIKGAAVLRVERS